MELEWELDWPHVPKIVYRRIIWHIHCFGYLYLTMVLYVESRGFPLGICIRQWFYMWSQEVFLWVFVFDNGFYMWSREVFLWVFVFDNGFYMWSREVFLWVFVFDNGFYMWSQEVFLRDTYDVQQRHIWWWRPPTQQLCRTNNKRETNSLVFWERHCVPSLKKKDMRITRYGGGLKSGEHRVVRVQASNMGRFEVGGEDTNYMTNANGNPTSHKNTQEDQMSKIVDRILRLVEPANNSFGMVVDHNFFHVG